ncbi:MAG: hypothetical protein ACKO16_12280 [Gemmataceae bacterium]
MPYESIDKIQIALAKSVFKNKGDKKKAAGRALGTIVELITYFWLKKHGFRNDLSIEHKLFEFGNSEIRHNVEFGLHPIVDEKKIIINHNSGVSLTAKKFKKSLATLPDLESFEGIAFEGENIVDKNNLIKNSNVVFKNDDFFVTLNVDSINAKSNEISVTATRLNVDPYAIVECKRVGIEDGARKGPTTIEKAKQGAYVAKHSSKLQKIKDENGVAYGVIPVGDGKFNIEEYHVLLKKLIDSKDPVKLKSIVLTVGITSNHGNWFTASNMNKELKVLEQSYDWLLFLKDAALVEFVNDLILNKIGPTNKAFRYTYSGNRKKNEPNRLTKSKILYEAFYEIDNYFGNHWTKINDHWFEILGPNKRAIAHLVEELKNLKGVTWK